MPLAVSITLPPPTAISRSQPAARAKAAPCSTTCTSELGGTSSKMPTHGHAGAGQPVHDALHQPGPAQHLVGDDDRARAAELLGLEAHLTHHSGTVEDPRPHLELEELWKCHSSSLTERSAPEPRPDRRSSPLFRYYTTILRRFDRRARTEYCCPSEYSDCD